ncbi:MAG: peptide chain release factor N(5)-glutamine methyltransferase [bacterium]
MPATTPPPRTIGEFVAAGAAYLARHRVDSPRVACELLACRLFRCARLELFLHYAETPAPRLVEAWRRGLKRVADGEPLQYVLGEWDFRRLTLTVDRRALIPRPETELLVDLVLEAKELWNSPMRTQRSPSKPESAEPPLCAQSRSAPSVSTPTSSAQHPLILDVGTGSGCIVLSLATERPAARYIAMDASAEALALARENAARCGLADRVAFRQATGCGEFPAGSVDAIVANLPYIPTAAVAVLERHIRDHEPLQALDGGADGLDIVRLVARDAAMVLRPGGGLFLEIGDEQGPAARDLLEHLGFSDIAILPDLAGRTRFARARHGA